MCSRGTLPWIFSPVANPSYLLYQGRWHRVSVITIEISGTCSSGPGMPSFVTIYIVILRSYSSGWTYKTVLGFIHFLLRIGLCPSKLIYGIFRALAAFLVFISIACPRAKMSCCKPIIIECGYFFLFLSSVYLEKKVKSAYSAYRKYQVVFWLLKCPWYPSQKFESDPSWALSCCIVGSIHPCFKT